MRRRCLGCSTPISQGSYCKPCHPYNNRTWRDLSADIIRRDVGRCTIQGSHCTLLATTTDHIIPVAAGGTDNPDNLRAACRECNSAARAAKGGAFYG